MRKAKNVVAPMVDQSELPWRMLGRRYGAELCYTPMLHAALFQRDQNYRKDNFAVCKEDRPLIVQFCANNPETLLAAARYVAPHCDAVDINLGCPQAIAKKGHYGAFLQEEWDLIASMITLLNEELSVPVTCKVRVFEDIEKTVRYAKMLEKAGCQLLTVHGRTREQKGGQTGLASWAHIRAVRQNVTIPVFANGNIQFLKDVERCLSETGVVGVMSAESHLFNPALFVGEHPPCWRVSEEYLNLVRQFPCSMSAVRGHFFKIWLQVLKEPDFHIFREHLGVAKTLQEFDQICGEMKSLMMGRLSTEELNADFTPDNIPIWRCQPYIRPNRGIVAPAPKSMADLELLAQTSTERALRKKRAADVKAALGPAKKKRWFACGSHCGNPKGLKCVNEMCKICCRQKCVADLIRCRSHRFTPRPQQAPGRDGNTEPPLQSREDTTSASREDTASVSRDGSTAPLQSREYTTSVSRDGNTAPLQSREDASASRDGNNTAPLHSRENT